ncbi:GNAT family N-acetyltransferase [Deinococcus lacus]|uniref:GNAT family N-acetyltransferase n=1 Tax=Deinococcus lacus TaxID=392561 RepID=A0ABW1YGF8_9DEIO
MTTFTFRDPVYPADAAAIAEVLNAADPTWPMTAEQVAHYQAARDPALFITEVLAVQAGQVVGTGSLGHDSVSHEDWRYWGDLAVHPQARGQGIGAALYSELLRRVQERRAKEIRTMLSDLPHDAPGVRFITARGFVPTWTRYESSLHTDTADLHAFDDLMERVAAGGIVLTPLSELSGPEHERWLYELDWLLFQDVPMGLTLTRRTQEQWVKDELKDPTLRPELSFVAVDPTQNDPLTGFYIGYSTIGWNEMGGYGYIGMTGVRREYRGRGIAKALKVAAMRALAAAGGGEIRTFNDAPNVAMLKMNEALGFRRTATRTRYELRLEGEQ